MNVIRTEQIISIGLAIFSMLFGAGNLMYPLQVGTECGNLTFYGILGFGLTAVCLPIAGFIGMLLFDGNYKSFYYRLGVVPGGLLLFASIMIIGPVLAIPRIVTLSHTMFAPFLPGFLHQITTGSSLVFALLFLTVTFFATFRENKIITILGRVISPLLLLSLIIIIGAGLWGAQTLVMCSDGAFEVFKSNFIRGYETLDLFGAIFFASIILTLLKGNIGSHHNPRVIAAVGLQAGIIGILLLGVMYIGLSVLGMYYGHGLEYDNAGELLREIAFKVLGPYGAFLVGVAALMAFLSTAIALSAVVAEYVEHTLFRKKISFLTALVMVLTAAIPLSTFGLDRLLQLTSGPIVYVGYPMLITLTMCNIAYKLSNFKYVKIPVLVALIVALVSYLW